MPPLEKFLKTLPGETKPCSQLHKDVIEKEIKIYAMNQPEKRVKMNDTLADIGDIELYSHDVVQSLITTL